MRSLIREIRQQPLYIRHIFMWTMVVITFSIVGFAWFKKTSNDFVALLQREKTMEETDSALAEESSSESPFAIIKNSISDLQANILDIFRDKDIKTLLERPEQSAIPPARLPVN